MTTNRIALWTLAAGFAFAAVAAQGQSNPYGSPGYPQPQGEQGQYGQQDPGYDQGQYEDDWRESDNWYDPQSDDGYDQGGQNGQYDPYGHNGGYDDRHQPPSVEVGFFYGALSPYGEWVRHPYYGWVWFPRNMQAGWRPYSNGRWVMSDYGWTWVSYERFGWATYHYGRWAWDRYVGWLWVPGTDWAPAWVAWQQGNGYIGWAPLPPAVGFDLRVGIQLGGFNLSFGIAPRNYAFVEERRFLDNRIGGYIVPEARNVTIIHNTTNITNYTVVDNRVINRGVALDRVERVTGRRAQRMRIAQANAPGTTEIDRDVVRIYRPAETKLESVKVAQRNNAGLRQVAKPGKAPKAQPPVQVPNQAPKNGRPYAQEAKPQGRGEVAIPVAPRVPPAPAKVNERQFTREQEALRANQQKQQQELQQMQRREKTQAPPPVQQAPKGRTQGEAQGAPGGKAQGAARANPQEVQQRHAAELEEQKVLRERTAEQLKNRQQLQRQAAQATAEQAKEKSQAQAGQPKQKQSGKAKPEATKEQKQKQKGQKDKEQQEQNDQKPPQSF